MKLTTVDGFELLSVEEVRKIKEEQKQLYAELHNLQDFMLHCKKTREALAQTLTILKALTLPQPTMNSVSRSWRFIDKLIDKLEKLGGGK